MLQDKILEELKQAQLKRDEVKVSTLRLLLSEVKNFEIQKGQALSDEDVISVIQKEAKKRKEAAIGFRQGAREDSALKEESELKVLESYLPDQLSNGELTKLVEDTISEVDAKSIQDIGKVMGVVMGKVKGRADGNIVRSIVRSKLS